MKSCGKTYECINMIEGQSGWYCRDCRDYCNVCEEPFEKGAGYDCESCRLSSDARICPDCIDENRFVRCSICKATYCESCDDNLTDNAPDIPELPVYRECCKKVICRMCSPSSKCDGCYNFCTNEKDCKFWHMLSLRDCCETTSCQKCAPSTECEVCANEYCTDDDDCRRWHLEICKRAKKGRVEK